MVATPFLHKSDSAIWHFKLGIFITFVKIKSLNFQIKKEIIVRIDKWDWIKLERLCTTKETISKVKRQSKENLCQLSIHQEVNAQNV
jgi:hypothetical protein